MGTDAHEYVHELLCSESGQWMDEDGVITHFLGSSVMFDSPMFGSKDVRVL